MRSSRLNADDLAQAFVMAAPETRGFPYGVPGSVHADVQC